MCSRVIGRKPRSLEYSRARPYPGLDVAWAQVLAAALAAQVLAQRPTAFAVYNPIGVVHAGFVMTLADSAVFEVS